MGADQIRFFVEWDEWDGRPGFTKTFIKKGEIVEGNFDGSILEGKPLASNMKVYILDELKIVKQDDGNYSLVRGGNSSGGENGEDQTKGKRVRSETKSSRKGHSAGKTNKDNDNVNDGKGSEKE